jgi:DNA-binding CsgD family transcriptional regulator
MMRLNYDKSQQVIMQMLSEKKREKEKQYLLIAGIILSLVIGFVIYRQQVQRSRLEKELLLQQKLAAEEASTVAREQLDLFTAHIIEKNDMIDKLQDQLKLQHQSIHDELITQTILTDEDWTRFKSLFEKARPGFFEHLQSIAPGITPAELRLAALLQLKLDTKNIAAMQGISPDAVRKSKSRLRQRLNITVEDGLEAFIHAISINA